ncbi:MAG: SpoIIE family protein phosphatase [Bacilli bacterium]|jgi:serine/threonine protein phosphatase PrpC|nr:SpoIIE family protein phosphatase [Acholeplasmataceae bacterium]
MNKYLNIIIISFFSALTLALKNVGYVFFIPIACFFTFSNPKNILLIAASSILAILLYDYHHVWSLLIVLSLITIYTFVYKEKQYLINLVFILLVNFLSLSFLLKENKDYILNLIFSFIGVALYSYFTYNMEGIAHSVRSRNFTYNEVIMAIISVIGATALSVSGINFALPVAMFFAMYFSKNQYPLHSVFFSLISMFFLRFVFALEESLLIPFVSAFYMFPSFYAPIALVCFSLLGILSKMDIFPLRVLEATIVVCVFFEIVKTTIVSAKTSEKIIKNVYQRATENINNEIISFASFLDLFSKKFATTKEYSQKLSGGINSLTRNYCEACYVRGECFSNNKGKLYDYLKNMILYSKRKDHGNEDPDFLSFTKLCPYIVEMRKSCMLINERLNLSAVATKANALVAQLNGISNVLRQFSVDNALKTEIDYEVFANIHRGLNDYGFNVCYFEVLKNRADDFLIEIGIKGENYMNLKPIVEAVGNHYMENETSCIFKNASRGKTYVNLVPKINFEIEYGYGALAQEGNNVCGDNYLIKQLNNSRLIAAISDGMGKGYLAYQESGNTLKFVDEITKTAISTETGLQILNTFYFIQDYLEKYSTLDFLEINRSKGELTFYKMGAASSYIFHQDNSFVKVTNTGLPFGIEEMIEAKKYPIQGGDLIIMASDGIFENIDSEKELEDFINGIKHLSPQKITYEILNYARSQRKKGGDDMSVISLKIIAAQD